MKKFFIFLFFCSYAFVSAYSQVPAYSSANPVVSSLVGNTAIIKVKWSVKVRGNTGNTNSFFIKVGSANVYSALGRFWTDATFSKESDIIKINPLDSTEVWVVLENPIIQIKPQTSFSVDFRVGTIQNALTAQVNARKLLSPYTGELPNLVSVFPANGAIDALTNDTLRFKYSTQVNKGYTPLNIYVKNVTTSNILIIYDIDNANVNLQADGYYINLFNVPLHTDSTYSVYFDDGFLLENYITEDPVLSIADGEWVFSTKEITAVPPFVPVNGATAASISSDYSITFSENIVKNVGYIYIKDYDNINTVIETINVANCSVSGATLTIPHTTLNGGYHYFIEMDKDVVKSSSAGIRFKGIKGKSTWHFTTESANVWTGNGATNDFTDAGNWQNPPYSPTQPTIIQNSGVVKITTSENATDFTISDIGKVEITSTGSLTLSGKLTLASTSSSNGSLIVNGSLSVSPSNVYIYQFAGNTSTQRKGYSSPVSGATGTALGITSAIRRFDNPTNIYVPITASTSWDAGVGYTAYTSTPLVFKGTINTAATYSRPLLYTSDPGPSFQYSSAYNFYGNPYSAALDWKKTWDSFTVGEQALLYPTCWVEIETGSWKVINLSTNPISITGWPQGGTEIPRGHAFMLRAKPGSGGGDASNTIVFKKANLVVSNQTMLKSASVGVTKGLRFTAISKNYKDDILYSFNSQSLFDFEITDSEYQSFPSTSAAFTDRLQIATYSVSSTPIALAINTVPDFVNSTKFNVAYFAKNSGPYAIELTNVDAAFKTPNTVILLTDTVLNQTIPMVEGDKYYFYTDVTAAVVKNRFKIEIQSDYNVPTTITTPTVKKSTATLYYSNNNIHINLANDELSYVDVYSTNGELVLHQMVSGSKAEVPFEGNGVYIVKVVGQSSSSAIKIIAN